MTMHAPAPDVPLPPGAQSDNDWDSWDNECRIIHGPTRSVAKDVFVQSTAVQLPNGMLEHDDGHGGEAPSITVSCAWSENLTVQQARHLAAAIVAAADEVEAWTAWANNVEEVAR